MAEEGDPLAEEILVPSEDPKKDEDKPLGETGDVKGKGKGKDNGKDLPEIVSSSFGFEGRSYRGSS